MAGRRCSRIRMDRPYPAWFKKRNRDFGPRREVECEEVRGPAGRHLPCETICERIAAKRAPGSAICR